jgi:hypothetical protein
MSGRLCDDSCRQVQQLARRHRRSPRSLLCLAGAAALTAAPAPARREAPPVKGIYYGSFSNSNGRFTPAEIRLTWQSGKRVAGWLVLSAAYPEIPLDGTVTSSGGLKLSGRKRTYNANWRVRLTATCEEGSGENTMVIRGGYRLSGPVSERGDCEVIGLKDY